ncbi:hypothetical protein [Marinifilum fragile]|uniref:hypothetical protein n=1 Tax=Marinifilum fragile TaxID=570161 RepID=UPI002AAB85B1|nr:hypothetical protein [Marinifilum fragile]
MNNADMIHYIESKMNQEFKNNCKVVEKKYEKQPNNNFFISFTFQQNTITIIKDKGIVEVEFSYLGKYKMLHEYNSSFINLTLNKDNIDKIIQEISKNRLIYFAR